MVQEKKVCDFFSSVLAELKKLTIFAEEKNKSHGKINRKTKRAY